jgi:AraC-like DNA-binding protein
MTIYQQIQRALDYIENALSSKMLAEQAATQAFMSLRSFYTYFQMITGFTFKEYVIKRRLSKGVNLLKHTEETIIQIALDVGYESHEAFSRVFKKEFEITPKEYRSGMQELKVLEKIELIEEMYMGVIIKKLSEMEAYVFTGFQPNPEGKAFSALEEWKEKNNREDIPSRIFGHNIDKDGNISYEPENEGYKMLFVMEKQKENPSGEKEIINQGKFVVTGIEGNFENDSEGRWIMEGWERMNQMVEKKGYKVKEPVRWFEEHLEPSKPGNLRLDLYLEIE